MAEQTDPSEGRIKNPTAQRIPPHLMGKSPEPLGHLGNELLVRPKGWVEPTSVRTPPGQDAIERLANAALPHGRESKAR